MAGPFGFQDIDLSATPAATLVHIGFCKINALALYNHTTSLIVVQIFDLARAPILGTDKPTWQFAVPSAGTADQGTNQFCPTFVAGLKCVNGLAYAACTNFNGQSGGNTLISGNSLTGTIDWELRP
jgi:hypothetical protein